MDRTTALTERELRILLALAGGALNGYALVQQMVVDAADELTVSNGTLYPALARLDKAGLVGSEIKGRQRQWRIMRPGRMALQWQLSVYRRLVRLGDDRL